MTLFKQAFAALAISGLFLCAPQVRADEWNKKTTITIDQQVQLPNVVLQPGTYVFKLLDSQSDRHIVQIFNKDENQIITTILAIPNYRLEPTGKTVFTFWEVPAGEIPSVRAWFYPGAQFGEEFAYPKHRAARMAAYTNTSIPTSNAQSAEEMKTTPVTTTDQTTTAVAEPAPAPEPAPQAAPPTAPEVAQAAPAPEPQPEPLPQELPHTASETPLIGILGVLSIAAFVALKRASRVV